MNQQIPVDLEEEQVEAPIQPHYEPRESSEGNELFIHVAEALETVLMFIMN